MAIRVDELHGGLRPDHACPSCAGEAAVRRPRLALVGEPEHAGQPVGAGSCVPARTYALRRAAVLLVIVLLAAGAAAFLGARTSGGGSAAAPAQPSGGDQQSVVLAPGETLWDVLAPHTPAGTGRQDFIALVLDANGLDGSAVAPGRVIRLPAP